MIDYAKNIESIDSLSDQEKDFLIAYFCSANQSLKKLYHSNTNKYKYWHRWLSKHQYILYKIVNFSKVDLIKNSADAFNYVLNNCVEIVENCNNKQNKTKIKALEVIQKICGLETYAQKTIADLQDQAKGNQLAQLTTAQLKQLASNVSDNLRLLADSTPTKKPESDTIPEGKIINLGNVSQTLINSDKQSDE